jgi:hypothetical protein
MGEKVDAPRESEQRGDNRRVVSECVIAVLFALNGLEGVYDFPQAGDDPLLICCKILPTSFELHWPVLGVLLMS